MTLEDRRLSPPHQFPTTKTRKAMRATSLAVVVLLVLTVVLSGGDFLRCRLWPPEKDAYLLPGIGTVGGDWLRAILIVEAGGVLGLLRRFRPSRRPWRDRADR